ncbi:MAG: hypothetical protein FJZ01_28155 [Candidatus Sericytochromatia bacterium]|nr:hypothetical protein [Candidatus Tanganyikabacteria bacterium]
MKRQAGTKPAGATEERSDASALLPPVALAIALIAASAPVLASGAGGDSAGPMTVADALYFDVWAPNPYVGWGARTISHTRAWLEPAPTGAYNGVGVITLDYQSNRHLSYQIKDTNGSYSYILTQGYPLSSTVSSALWRNSGNNWHFHWWGSGFNVYVNADNTRGSNLMQTATLGAEAWGGCPSEYHGDAPFWGWRWRHKDYGYWEYLGGVNNFYSGNTPSWGPPAGNAANGNGMWLATTTCP